MLKALALLAQRYDIGLNIDAEEADRLELSLDLLERLCFEPELAGWNGIGFVVQAYQKRCPFVIDWLDRSRAPHRPPAHGAAGQGRLLGQRDQARAGRRARRLSGLHAQGPHRRLLPRLRAQAARGARRGLPAVRDAQRADAGGDLRSWPAPRFAPGQYEFQCLHGMGEPLYEQVVGRPTKLDRPCRIYAPVGTHETLLAYLVRRLLENGANTSFVNRIADPAVPIDELIADPVRRSRAIAARSRGAARPAASGDRRCRATSIGGARLNSRGLDLSNERARVRWRRASLRRPGSDAAAAIAPATRAGDDGADAQLATATRSPCAIPPTTRRRRPRRRGDARRRRRAAASAAMARAAWAATAAGRARRHARARRRCACEARMPLLLGLHRARGRQDLSATPSPRCARRSTSCATTRRRRAATLATTTQQPLGPVVCISPWNFPLAIFTGQVAAALAAGNPVLAKPAEETPLIAAEAVRLLHEAGVPARRAAAAARATANGRRGAGRRPARRRA